MRIRTFKRSALLCACLATLVSESLLGATHTWKHPASGYGYWSDPFNWNGGPPSPGEPNLVLHFPDRPAQYYETTINDLVGLTVQSITLDGSGYYLQGNALSLLGGVTSNGLNSIVLPITVSGTPTLTSNLYDVSLSGALTGAAGAELRIAGAGMVVLAGPSGSFAGRITVQPGAMLIVAGGPNPLGSSSTGTTVRGGGRIAFDYTVDDSSFTEPLTLESGAILSDSSAGTIVSGPIALSGMVTIESGWTATLALKGVLSGPASLAFKGISSSTKLLTANNTYTGSTTVETGMLLVNGSQPQSPIAVVGSGGLGGVGTTGPVTFAPPQTDRAILDPGGPGPGSTGVLHVSGSTLLNLFSTFHADLRGLSPGSYDQLETASVTLGGARLEVNRLFSPPAGTVLTIVKTTTGTVTGTFFGVPDGASLDLSGQTYRITYKPQSVELKAITAPPNFPPTISATTQQPDREETGPPIRSILGTVGDLDTPLGSLSVTVAYAPSWISVTNLTTVDGVIEADIAVLCRIVEPGQSPNLVLRVSDGTSQATASLYVPYTPENVPPVVTPPSPSSVTVNQTRCDGATLADLQSRYPDQYASLDTLVNGNTATDNCTPTPTQLPSLLFTSWYVPPTPITSSTVIPIGTRSVIPRFQDAAGNIGQTWATVTVARQGDLDLDGDVDVFDVVIVASYLVGNLQPGVAPFAGTRYAVDGDGDGDTDLFDLVLLAGHIVGNVSCLTP